MIANINYKGEVSLEAVKKMKFPIGKPCQIKVKTDKNTILFFRTGKCRIMGCKKPLKPHDLSPYDIKNIQLQSLTVVVNMGTRINLYKLAKIVNCWFEPEIFSALRPEKYNPICVNVFSTGKVVILGLKTLNFHGYVDNITSDLFNLIEKI